jgi:hypothetical protein
MMNKRIAEACAAKPSRRDPKLGRHFLVESYGANEGLFYA